jgi:hypothetical protein
MVNIKSTTYVEMSPESPVGRNLQLQEYALRKLSRRPYSVKKVSDIPVHNRDVTYQTLPILIIPAQKESW